MDDYSGKVLVRMPKELHQWLTLSAKRNDVSLNQYIVYLLTVSQVMERVEGGSETLKEKNITLEEIRNMGQDTASGRKGNQVGRAIGASVARELGIDLQPGSNKGIFEGRSIVIKSARIGNTQVGITNRTLEEIDGVILAREITPGNFELSITNANDFIETGSPTRSKGASRGKVTNFRVGKITSSGRLLGSLNIDLPNP